jgi:hypothetical protein
MESWRVRGLASWLARHHQVVTGAEAQRLGIGVRTVERLVEQGDSSEAYRSIIRMRGTGVLRAHLLERGHIGAPYPSVLESRTVRLFVRPEVVAAEVLAAYEQRAAGVGLVPAAGGE